MINRQRDTIFAPNIKMLFQKETDKRIHELYLTGFPKYLTITKPQEYILYTAVEKGEIEDNLQISNTSLDLLQRKEVDIYLLLHNLFLHNLFLHNLFLIKSYYSYSFAIWIIMLINIRKFCVMKIIHHWDHYKIILKSKLVILQDVLAKFKEIRVPPISEQTLYVNSFYTKIMEIFVQSVVYTFSEGWL